MPRLLLFVLLGLVCIALFISFSRDPKQIRYVALGDSYTYGTGAGRGQDWPSVLTANLHKKGINIALVGNLAQSGWTTKQVLDLELPVYHTLEPSFATLQIGANDWVRGVPPETFRQNLAAILEGMLKDVPSDRIIVVTIPDYSITPGGIGIGLGREASSGIQEFNMIIQEESAKRKIMVVDVFEVSQAMRDDPTLVSDDGLHPSAKEYAIWEQLIYPVAYNIIHP